MDTPEEKTPGSSPLPSADSKANQASDHILAETEQRNERERFATVQAQLALQAFVLRKLDEGGFIATRWGICRELPDLESVERFAVLIGAAPPRGSLPAC